MLTRKHFRAMAAAVAAIEDQTKKEAVYEAYVTLARESNPRFDEGIFWDACDMGADDEERIHLAEVAAASDP